MTDLLPAVLASTSALSGGVRLLLMIPLCLSVAIVYKTTRCEDLSRLPREVGALLVTIVLGMAGVGIGLWVLFQWMV